MTFSQRNNPKPARNDFILGELGQRLPPQNLEAEQSLLGAMMLSADAITESIESLSADDFYRQAHGYIFQAIVDLYAEGEPADAITVPEKLQSMGKLEEIGGKPYIHTLVASVPDPGNAGYYAEIVERSSVLRSLIVAADQIAKIAYSSPDDVRDALDEAESIIFSIAKNMENQNLVSIKTILNYVRREIEIICASDKHIAGHPTGFDDLDRITGGLHSSNLIVVAGRPGMGKTSFALNIAFNMGLKGIPVAIFSLEMSKEELVQRMLCSQSRVDSWKLRNGRLTDGEWNELAEATSRLSEAPISIDDTPTLSPLELKRKARHLAARYLAEKKNLGLIIVDYLQLMHSYNRKSDSREQEVSQISRALKALGRELKVPVIAVSQLSRDIEKRKPKIPQLSDLRESGAIEQDADIVIFLYKEEDDDFAEDSNRERIIVHIAKHRNGPTGKIELLFLKKYVRFHEIETHRATSF